MSTDISPAPPREPTAQDEEHVCGTGRHPFGSVGCEYHDHHCAACHEKNLCTKPECKPIDERDPGCGTKSCAIMPRPDGTDARCDCDVHALRAALRASHDAHAETQRVYADWYGKAQEFKSALATETEARWRAEAERDAAGQQWPQTVATLEAALQSFPAGRIWLKQWDDAIKKASEVPGLTAALDEERANVEYVKRERESLREQRDSARAELEAVRRERNALLDARWHDPACFACKNPIASQAECYRCIDCHAIFHRDCLRWHCGDELVEARAALATAEQERDRATVYAKAQTRERKEAEAALATAEGRVRELEEVEHHARWVVDNAWRTDDGQAFVVDPAWMQDLVDALDDLSPPPSPSATREGEDWRCALCDGREWSEVNGQRRCRACGHVGYRLVAAPPPRETAVGKDGGE